MAKSNRMCWNAILEEKQWILHLRGKSGISLNCLFISQSDEGLHNLQLAPSQIRRDWGNGCWLRFVRNHVLDCSTMQLQLEE